MSRHSTNEAFDGIVAIQCAFPFFSTIGTYNWIILIKCDFTKSNNCASDAAVISENVLSHAFRSRAKLNRFIPQRFAMLDFDSFLSLAAQSPFTSFFASEMATSIFFLMYLLGMMAKINENSIYFYIFAINNESSSQKCQNTR